MGLDLAVQVADCGYRAREGGTRLPQNLVDILIAHDRLEVRAMTLGAEGDTPRARAVIEDVGQAALAAHDGCDAPQFDGPHRDVVVAVGAATGWPVAQELRRHALAAWEAPWALGRCQVVGAGPQLAQRFATRYLLPALECGVVEPAESGYAVMHVLREGVSDDVAGALAKFWTVQMIADEGDEELADGLVEVFTQRGLVLPTPAEAKFGGEHLRWLVAGSRSWPLTTRSRGR